MPIIKNDYRLFETYPHGKKVTPLSSNLVVMLGNKDVFTNQYVEEEWGKLSIKSVAFFYFNDGHFFINSSLKSLVKRICDLVLVEKGIIE